MISATRPLLYLISGGAITNENFRAGADDLLSLVEHAVHARIPLIQIREKRLSARLLCGLTRQVAAAARGTLTRVLVNERLDIALAAGADGVHLPSSSVPPDVVRKWVSDGFLIGTSVHSLDEIEVLKTRGADFAVFGPVFETPGKSNPVGIAGLEAVVKSVHPFPVLALGGINESNYKTVLAAGAAGFAAIRFLNSKANLEKLSSEFAL